MVPAIFLAVAAFLVNMVLARLIAIQRPEIATLKAIGYGNGALRAHFAGLAAVVLLPGAAVGVAGGWLLGHGVLSLYARVFRFPEFRFELTFALVAAGVLMSGVAVYFLPLPQWQGAFRDGRFAAAAEAARTSLFAIDGSSPTSPNVAANQSSRRRSASSSFACRDAESVPPSARIAEASWNTSSCGSLQGSSSPLSSDGPSSTAASSARSSAGTRRGSA